MEARCPEKAHPDTYEITDLYADVAQNFGVTVDHLKLDDLDPQGIADEITEYLCKEYEGKEGLIGSERLRYSERMIMLQLVDQQWKDHLLSMDHLKEGIGLRGYGQKDPLIEYKKESFTLFEDMMARFEEETLKFLFHLQPAGEPQERAAAGPAFAVRDGGSPVDADQNGAASKPEAEMSIEEFTRDVRRKKERELAQANMAGSGDGGGVAVKQIVKGDKVGRNDPCPCGSGKKFKKCHGAAKG